MSKLKNNGNINEYLFSGIYNINDRKIYISSWTKVKTVKIKN